MHRRTAFWKLARRLSPPLVDSTARVPARVQIVADCLFHLGDQNVYISPCIEDILLQFPKPRQKIACRQKRPSVRSNRSISRSGIRVFLSGKKSGHLIVFFKRLWYLQTPFVFLEEFPLDQLILKQILPIKQHLHAGIQRKCILNAMNHGVIFWERGKNLLPQPLNRRAGAIKGSVDFIAQLRHPRHVNTDQVVGAVLHAGLSHLIVFIVGDLYHIHFNSGLPGEGRKKHANRLAGQILDRQKTDALFLTGRRKWFLIKSVVLHDDLLLLCRGDLTRYVSAHQLIVQLISAHIRIDANALAGQRIDYRHLFIRIILVGRL